MVGALAFSILSLALAAALGFDGRYLVLQTGAAAGAAGAALVVMICLSLPKRTRE